MADRAASIHARLLVRAKAQGEDFNLTLTQYALERFLYRLSVSDARDQFLLKGALLFNLWFNLPHRPTRDMDLLGAGPDDADALSATMGAVCGVEVDDGMYFDPKSIRIEPIREEARYGGQRLTLMGRLGDARCPMQIDIGFGDAVTPGPEEAAYPVLLEEQPAPRLKVYPRPTVFAEKLEAIAQLGMANSRMKDYFDLRSLVLEGAIDKTILTAAVRATFARRGTPLPKEMPVGLTESFASDSSKLGQWSGFLRKNRLEAPALAEVVAEIREYIREPLLGSGTLPKPALSAVFDRIESSNTTEQDIAEAVRWVRSTKK